MLNNNIEFESEQEPRFVLCSYCKYTRIYWIKGTALPYEYRTKKVHYCAVSESLCRTCGEAILLDHRILSPQNKRIPLSPKDGKYHCCPMPKKTDM